MLTLQDLKKSRKLSLQSFRTSESMSSSNVKVMKSRRRKITKAFKITTNMSMLDHSSANGETKKRSQLTQEIKDQDQVIKTSHSSSKDQDQVSKIGLLLKHKYIKYNYSLLIGLSPELTQVAICPIYHEPLILVSVNVMDRSIGIDIPVCLGLTLVKQTQFHLSQIRVSQIGIRALSYRELCCISDMSNSDELRHTDNTTLVPPRLPDTLSQVYHRRRPTLGLLVLPSVLPIPLTIRRTTRISIPPIKLNLAKRARISAINLDDYQLDPLTPPPLPLSPFSMAAYQRMIAETDPT
ncbi:hypothetical protein Tco_0667491 [Tanacetum coccineum]